MPIQEPSVLLIKREEYGAEGSLGVALRRMGEVLEDLTKREEYGAEGSLGVALRRKGEIIN